MKKFKIIISLLLSAIMLFSIASCKKCRKEDPRARIFNNGTIKASVQIKTSGGNTVNINNVDPGTASDYSSYDKGMVGFTITIDKIKVEKTIEMAECYDYDIAIDPNNNITSLPIDRNK